MTIRCHRCNVDAEEDEMIATRRYTSWPAYVCRDTALCDLRVELSDLERRIAARRQSKGHRREYRELHTALSGQVSRLSGVATEKAVSSGAR